VERSGRAQTTTPLFLPFGVLILLLSSLYPDVLYSEEVISLVLNRFDGVDSDSFGASMKLLL